MRCRSDESNFLSAVYLHRNTSLSHLDAVATNFLLICPSLESLTSDLPFSGRHVTRPSRGLFSLAPGGRKRIDPGNEVAENIGFQRLSHASSALKASFLSGRNLVAFRVIVGEKVAGTLQATHRLF